MMQWIAAAAAFLGFVSVVLGAAGDHMLEGKFTPETAETFDVALTYHQLYSVLIFVMAVMGTKHHFGKLYNISCLVFLIGILIFSGSLYTSLWVDLGPIALGTPAGGMLIMAGWILAGVSFFEERGV